MVAVSKGLLFVQGMGVGKGVFYWYFASKEELFSEKAEGDDSTAGDRVQDNRPRRCPSALRSSPGDMGAERTSDS